MTHLGTVSLHTDRLELRRLTFDDCQVMFDHWAEYLHELEKYYADPTFYNWGICLKNGTLIGSIGVGRAEKEASQGWQTLPAALQGTETWEAGYTLGHPW